MTSRTDRLTQNGSNRSTVGESNKNDGFCPSDVIRNQPVTSAIVTLAAGITAGFCLGAYLSKSSMSSSKTGVATRLGQHVIDSIYQVLPAQLSGK